MTARSIISDGTCLTAPAEGPIGPLRERGMGDMDFPIVLYQLERTRTVLALSPDRPELASFGVVDGGGRG
jgi:hypothetical protein